MLGAADLICLRGPRTPSVLGSPVVVVPMPLGQDFGAVRDRVIVVVQQHLHVKKLHAQASFEGQHHQSNAAKSCGDRQVATGAGLCSLGALSDEPARRRQVCDRRFASGGCRATRVLHL